MLKPSKMKRIRLVVSKGYYGEAMSALHDLGAMQIETVPEYAQRYLDGTVEQKRHKEISDYAQRFRALEAQMIPEQRGKRYLFRSLDDLFEKADSVMIFDRVNQLSKDIEDARAELKELEYRAEIAGRLSGFEKDLGILNNEYVISFIVSGGKIGEFADGLAKAMPGAISAQYSNAMLVSIERRQEADFGKFAEQYPKMHIEVVPKLEGKPGALRKSASEGIERVGGRLKAFEAELRTISEKHYAMVSAIREQFDIEVEELDAVSRIGATESVIAIDGWVPEEQVPKLKKAMHSATKDHFVIDDVATKELPPTRLENPATAKLFEFFIRFYSLPKSDEIDPTLIFAVVFPIFFGFMVGDAGYGAVMLALSLGIIYRTKHPGKRRLLPKKIGSFVHTIISDNGLNVIARAIIPGSIIAIFLGILFNEYFGFQLGYKAPFNVVTGLAKLLVISGWIGVAMVSFGFLLGFANKFAVNEKKAAYGKIGWLAAAWGFVIFGLEILHKQPLGLSNPAALISYVLLVGGVLTILKTDGFEALMELPSLISHILSYTRLVGILLASVILAEVIDQIFLKSITGSIVIAIFGIVILVFGQVFNIVIAIFESGIQGARLIYVEFFSKFFAGNGREFRPFVSRRKRTLSRFDIGEEKAVQAKS